MQIIRIMKQFIIFLLALLSGTNGNEPGLSEEETVTELPEIKEIFFFPKSLIKKNEGTNHIIRWYTTLPGAHHSKITVKDEIVSIVADSGESYGLEAGVLNFTDASNVTGSGYFNASLLFIGYNTFSLSIYDADNETLGVEQFELSVLLSYQLLNTIFTYCLGVLVFVVYVNMGATLDLEVVKNIVKKPIGPLIGIVCQYLFMPLAAFGLGKLYYYDDPLLQLGMFVNGASPGGGQSNIWTLLFGGSLDLSIMMTFTSTVVAFGTVPMWVFALGPYIVANTGFVIPYFKIFILVISLVIPCGIGIGIQLVFPRVSKFIEKHVLLKVSIFNLCFIVTFGFYANRYIFALFNWKILLASFSLPVLGYICGMSISTLAKRPKREIIAISIETGVQNANIAMLILKFTLDPPSGDLTVVIPVATVILTPLPLGAAYISKWLYERYCRSGVKSITKPEEEIEVPKAGVQNDSYVGPIEPYPKTTNGVRAVQKQHGGIDNPSADIGDAL